MKLADFEKCIDMMGLELISVNISAKGGNVRHALAVQKDGGKKVFAYNWYEGACRKSNNKISYADIRANHARYSAEAPLRWSCYDSFNISKLEEKYISEINKTHDND